MPKKQKRLSNLVRSSDHQANETNVTDDPVEAEEEKKYNKRSIQSNWEKYELNIPDNITEDSSLNANDFSALVKNANTSSHTFRFKSEQNWEKDIAEKKPYQLNLNLQALSAGLASIPFYERLGLDKNEFSKEDLKKCDDFAAKSRKKYEEVKNNFFKPDEDLELLTRHYESLVKKNKEDSELIRQKFLAQFSRRHRLHEITKSECDKGSVVDEITEEFVLNAEMNNDLSGINEQLKTIDIDVEINDKLLDVKSNSRTKIIVNEDENLEDWLDSVLDS